MAKKTHSPNWGGPRPNSGRPSSKPKPGNSSGITVPAQPKTMTSVMSQSSVVAAIERMGARRRGGDPEIAHNLFRPAVHPPRAMPPENVRMAMDDSLGWAQGEFTAAYLSSVGFEAQMFPGFAYLAQLAQRPEYRTITETIADDSTRKWIDFEVTGDEAEQNDQQRRAERDPEGEAERMADPDERQKRVKAAGKTDKVKALKDDQARLEVQSRFYDNLRNDGFFGRAHFFLDFGDDIANAPVASSELSTPIGDGRGDLSISKIKQGSFRRIQCVEPVWTYPTTYNALNPLREDWYNPQVWYVMGTQIHASRLLTIIGHPVPDLLKPAYSFGGLSMSQMAEPYVNIWLTTRQSVADMIHSFSVMVLLTDLSTMLQPGAQADLAARVQLFNQLRDNQGVFIGNKATEDVKNVSASLAGLHELQAQAEEHMSLPARIPLVKLTGISPSGLNACLPGDVLISTDRGQVPIRDVTLSDQVMTRRGLAPMTFSGITKYATELIEIRTESASLRCTANHPIWLPSINEFVPAENVRHGDLLLLTGAKSVTPKMHRPWHGADSGGGKIRAGTISPGMLSPSERSISIEKYGKHIAGLFQRVFTSTTWTAIKETISLPTLRRCMEFSMLRTMASSLAFAAGVPSGLSPYVARSAKQNLLSRNSRAERNSAAAPACSPIGDQTAYPWQGGPRSVLASCAARLLARFAGMLSFARVNVQQRAKTAPNTSAHTILRILKNINEPPEAMLFAEPVVSVRRVPASEPVYDLTVAPGHLPEFFANGILTHNSSEGEIQVYDDTIGAYQHRLVRPPLQKIINFEQLSLWGEVDPEITFVFQPLRELTEKEKGEKQKADAERHGIYVDQGTISPAEVRKIIIDDPELPYAGLDPEDVPDLAAEEEEGLMPGGKSPAGESEGGPGAEDANILPFGQDAGWEESDHPRKDDGKFGSGSGGSKSGGKSGKASESGPGAEKPVSIPKSERKHADLKAQFIDHLANGGAEKTADVPLSKLRATQDTVNESGPSSGEEGDAPIVGIRDADGNVHVVNGHHRIEKAKAAGAGTIKARIVDDAPAAPLPAKGLKRVGEQMGSNPGGVFEDKAGKRFYIKAGRSKEHVDNELAAADLYKLAGAPTLNYRSVEGGGHVATEMTKLDKKRAADLSPAERKRAQEDFVTHAWLANWDSVGTGGDNVGTIGGVPTSLDLGGALTFRARGAPKGAAFGNKVGEIETMRDPSMSPDAAKVYGGMTDEDLRKSAAKVAAIPDDAIRKVIKDRDLPAALADKLIARKADLAGRFKLGGDQALDDFEERAFTSCSTGGGFGGNTEFKITAIGKRAASVKKLSNHKSEDEVLYRAHTFFKVTKVDGAPGGKMTVHMTEVDREGT